MNLPSLQREKAAALAEELADQLAVPGLAPELDERPASRMWEAQALSKGAIGVAVLHGIRAQDGVGDPGRVLPWVKAATRACLSVAPGSGLWFGAPAVALALRVAVPGCYRPTVAQLDACVDANVKLRLDNAEQRLAEGRPARSNEFDLVRGLTGMGGYLLHRNPTDPLLARLLKQLIRLAEPVRSLVPGEATVPGWWTHDPMPGEPEHANAGGHANLGTAHGIAGPLALLALAMRHGVCLQGQAEAIDTISGWLGQRRQPGETGPWWPERVTVPELKRGATNQESPRRPSWCYGTPGIARALQLAGLALNDIARQEAAESALADCLADPIQLARIIDPAICHGWAGVVVTAAAAASEARDTNLTRGLAVAVGQLLDHARDPIPDDRPGLILGRAGVALTLHQLAYPLSDTSWHTCLLVN